MSDIMLLMDCDAFAIEHCLKTGNAKCLGIHIAQTIIRRCKDIDIIVHDHAKFDSDLSFYCFMNKSHCYVVNTKYQYDMIKCLDYNFITITYNGFAEIFPFDLNQYQKYMHNLKYIANSI